MKAPSFAAQAALSLVLAGSAQAQQPPPGLSILGVPNASGIVGTITTNVASCLAGEVLVSEPLGPACVPADQFYRPIWSATGEDTRSPYRARNKP